jgi:lysophospholipase L1-like esterase
MTRTRLRIFVALLGLAFAGTAAAAAIDTDTEVSQPTLLVIGDSFVAGAGVADAGKAYPALLADATGMRLLLDGQGGTGFINDARGTGNGDTSKLIDRLVADGQKSPDASVVVVDAGRNDLSDPIDEVGGAVSDYLDHARAQWPAADIVVVIPAFITQQPFDGYREVRSRFESSATKVGATLIDPIAEGWYQNVDVATLVSADRVHPNDAGALLIAQRMEESLRSHGLIPTAA